MVGGRHAVAVSGLRRSAGSAGSRSCRTRHGAAVRPPRLDVEAGADQGGALAHDRRGRGSRGGGPQPAAVVGDGDHGVGGAHLAVDVDRCRRRACRTALVIASWAIRNSSASTSGRSRVGALVEGHVDRDARGLGEVPGQGADRGAEALAVSRRRCAGSSTERRTSPTTALIRSRSAASRSRLGGGGRGWRRARRRGSRARRCPGRRRRASRGPAGGARRRWRRRAGAAKSRAVSRRTARA